MKMSSVLNNTSRTVCQLYPRLFPFSTFRSGSVDVQAPCISCSFICYSKCHSRYYHHVATNGKQVKNVFCMRGRISYFDRKKLGGTPGLLVGFGKHFCEHVNISIKQGYLEGVKDRFNGTWVDLSQLQSMKRSTNIVSDEIFNSLLSNSLDLWKGEDVSCVWLKVPIELSHFINVASRYKFEYHHAEGRKAVLCLWMNGNVENRIPRFATHQIGVSGVVLNEESREVLVVKDKNKTYNVWKFPGGLSDLGEDFASTAVREVLEETGIHTEFQSILAFRQSHDLPNTFGRSDIYILCRMKALSFDLRPCTEEIEAVQWMTIEQLLSQQDTSPFSRRMVGLIKQGLQHGFKSVDISPNIVESAYKKMKMQLFHRPLDEALVEDR